MICDLRKLKRTTRPFVVLAVLTLSLARGCGIRLLDALTVSAAILGVRRDTADGKTD